MASILTGNAAGRISLTPPNRATMGFDPGLSLAWRHNDFDWQGCQSLPAIDPPLPNTRLFADAKSVSLPHGQT